MATNFNIVKKPKKTDDEDFLDEDEIEVEEKKSSTADKKAKTRMLLFMGFVFGGIILLLLILYIVSLFSHHAYSYEQIETLLQNAAVSYFKDYPESLPAEDGDIVEIDSSNLVVAGKMKDLSEYTAEGVLCSGTVQVQKVNNDYNYIPFLNCGDSYTTVSLAQKIIEDGTVTSGYGLYVMNNLYVYRGENVNNYLQLENSLWRIVKITSDNEVVLINDAGILYNPKAWDDRYNTAAQFSSGINQYKSSRIYEYLEELYNNPSADENELLLSEKDKLKTVPFNLCVGKRSSTTEGFNSREECAESLPSQKYGLLTLSEYMMASIDTTCKTGFEPSCANYNYLSTVNNWWLVTANKDDNMHVYKNNMSGFIVSDYASSYSNVRPVIYLNSNILYKDGDGTLEKPYTVK